MSHSSENQRICALLTCHNRRTATLACLEALSQQELPEEGFKLEAILVDDGSTDDTAAFVRRMFPLVEVINGDGSLFWNRGMHRAFGHAIDQGFDFYLWVNDDTVLFPTGVKTLLETLNNGVDKDEDQSIIVGAIQDAATGKTAYGGLRKTSSLRRFDYHKLDPINERQQCDCMNGNVVLIPQDVVRTIGNMDPAFRHCFGDLDYALRAKAAGIRLWLTPDYVAACEANVYAWQRPGHRMNPKRLLQVMSGPKGLPLRDQWRFVRRHGGALWPIRVVSPYFRAAWLAFQPVRHPR